MTHVRLRRRYTCTPWRRLIAAAPDRIIRGGDCPHLSLHDKEGSIQLFKPLVDRVPDARTRARILADNPQALFGFTCSAQAGMRTPGQAACRAALWITSSSAGFTSRWNRSSVSITTSFGVCA